MKFKVLVTFDFDKDEPFPEDEIADTMGYVPCSEWEILYENRYVEVEED